MYRGQDTAHGCAKKYQFRHNKRLILLLFRIHNDVSLSCTARCYLFDNFTLVKPFKTFL